MEQAQRDRRGARRRPPSRSRQALRGLRNGRRRRRRTWSRSTGSRTRATGSSATRVAVALRRRHRPDDRDPLEGHLRHARVRASTPARRSPTCSRASTLKRAQSALATARKSPWRAERLRRDGEPRTSSCSGAGWAASSGATRFHGQRARPGRQVEVAAAWRVAVAGASRPAAVAEDGRAWWKSATWGAPAAAASSVLADVGVAESKHIPTPSQPRRSTSAIIAPGSWQVRVAPGRPARGSPRRWSPRACRRAARRPSRERSSAARAGGRGSPPRPAGLAAW